MLILYFLAFVSHNPFPKPPTDREAARGHVTREGGEPQSRD